MLTYIAKRIAYALMMIAIVSVIAFVIIQLPPGDYATIYAENISQTAGMDQQQKQQIIRSLTLQYGLDKPVFLQYFIWIWKIISSGDFGMSFTYQLPVSRILADFMPMTLLVGAVSLIFQFVVGIPIGIYSAVKKHTISDYVFTFLSFFGKSIPEFLFALVMMVLFFHFFGFSIGGFISQDLEFSRWNFKKILDLLKHMIIPIIVIGTSSTADTVRVLRATMLDELGKEYVRVARAKGLSEWNVILKYPLRIALNPIISAVGWQLPVIISGSLIVSIVMNLPTTGPLIYVALLSQDMYLAGAFVLALSAFTILGTLLSDILLVIADPRISYR